MFSSFSIRNFRCFESLSIEDSLDRVNLIAGLNSIGKTALLEAIYLLTGMGNVETIVQISNYRGLSGNFLGELPQLTELFWDSLFHNLDSSINIELEGAHCDGIHRVQVSLNRKGAAQFLVNDGKAENDTAGLELLPVYGNFLSLEHSMPDGSKIESAMFLEATRDGSPTVRVGSNPPIPPVQPFRGSYLGGNKSRGLQTAATKYTRIESEGEPSDLIESLRFIEPRLQRLRVGVVAGAPMLRGDIGIDRMVPLSLLGDGLGSLTNVLLAIADAPGGVVLIDEIENGIHHSVLPQVWQSIGEAARRYNAQVFATTHSAECIEAAHEAFREDPEYAFRLHRLERIQDKTHVITYDQGTLAAAIRSNLEVR